MTFYIENETEEEFPFSAEEVAKEVCREVLEEGGCPYDVEISLILTDNERIREVNRENRGIDRETDVLSFPQFDFETPSLFDEDELFLDEGAVMLGDIVLSKDKIYEQAEEYGHGKLRETAYLTVHSLMHLLGYDHMEDGEKAVMRSHEEAVLDALGYTR